MHILTLNIGSSSIKYQLFHHTNRTLSSKLSGHMSGIGTSNAEWKSCHDRPKIDLDNTLASHSNALSILAKTLLKNIEPDVIAHRVVHGGAESSAPALITEDILKRIESASPLAPLHNPIQRSGIKSAMQFFKKAKQIAIFDTAFHHTIPDFISATAIPHQLAEKYNIKKYGFHGTSFQYVSQCFSDHVKKTNPTVIICHLGNGASVCAVKDGKSFDTSMGLTPTGGLIMGTRCGDIDPGILCFLSEHEKFGHQELDRLINKKSGLLGIAGHSDMRTCLNLANKGDLRAQKAIQAFTHRVRLYIGGYLAILGTIDAIIFTGGIGENSSIIREKICRNLDHIGFALDPISNNKCTQEDINCISSSTSTFPLFVVKTQEERQMALLAIDVINNSS